MEVFCYNCKNGFEVPGQECPVCNHKLFSILPHERRVRFLEEHELRPEVTVSRIDQDPFGLDRLLSCEIEVQAPSFWRGRLEQLARDTDRLLLNKVSRGVRERVEDGEIRLVLELRALRSEGRCTWCKAFRRSLSNLAKEHEDGFRDIGPCPLL